MPEDTYQISRPAVHTARTIFRNFSVTPIATVEATEANVATIVDVCTQIFRAGPRLDTIVQVAPWNDSDALRDNLERLKGAVEAIQPTMQHAGRTVADDKEQAYRVSAPALRTAQMLLQQFAFARVGKLQPTEKNLAVLVDVCTGISRVLEAVQRLSSAVLVPDTPQEFGEHMKVVREAMRAVEIVRNRLPSDGGSIRVTYRQKQAVALEITKARLREAQALAARVSAARTVQEQQQVLQDAGIVRTI